MSSFIVDGGASALPARKSFMKMNFIRQTDDGAICKIQGYYVIPNWPADNCPLATNQIFCPEHAGQAD